ncbi:MAG: hypothetical protein U0797_06245 [Gemmataceae bacterium]
MFPGTHTTKRAALVSWAWVALGCVLSLTSSTDLTVLADVLDRNLPQHHDRSVAEVENDLDDDAQMLASTISSSKDGRRGERKQPPTCSIPWPDMAPCRGPHAPRPFASNAGRPGSEHGLRNGLGVPLLC